MKKALIVLTSHAHMGDTGTQTGFWLSELTHPYYAMADQGIRVDVVSIDGGETPVDPKSWDEEDHANARFLATPELVEHLKNSDSLASVDIGEYQAIVFAGGHGTMWDFPDSSTVQQAAVNMAQQGGVVAAICHGPAALVNVTLPDGTYLIANKRVTGFTNEEEKEVELTEVVPFLLEEQLKAASAVFVKTSPWTKNVVVDGKLVTGQNPQSAFGVGEAVAEILLE